MTTPRDVIKGSLELIGALAPNESVDGEEISGLYSRLNRMLSSWSTQGALIYADTLVEFTLTANDGIYTIGTGADINTPRPLRIKTAYVRDTDQDYPIEIIDEYKYSLISQKDLQSSYPEALYYNPDYPSGTIKLYPYPGAAYTLFMEVEQALTQFTGLSQTISFPEGYEEALEYNFAVRIAPIYGKPVPMEVVEIANDTLANIKRANRKNDMFEATLSTPSSGQYDILGDRTR